MENKKIVTAVKWLEQEFIALQNYGINELGLFSKAKAMEKEQIMDDYMAGIWAWSEHTNNNKHQKDPAEYYNETYGRETDSN
jgi:hypothetical protein